MALCRWARKSGFFLSGLQMGVVADTRRRILSRRLPYTPYTVTIVWAPPPSKSRCRVLGRQGYSQSSAPCPPAWLVEAAAKMSLACGHWRRPPPYMRTDRSSNNLHLRQRILSALTKSPLSCMY
ncbi:hypothetical protein B0T17DRAFT_361820 [Bombardia bombarda]|uniref:Uncharacterized protein n=1 Tax=Bombardia bombarda TaxID=252184 RepID=A0AA40BWA7_9PEZI|nr:hypothetical protein B0T17DRAFT_361820 [Bombardia bombarda]